MIRVGDLALYSLLKADTVMPFVSDAQRTVRLTVNAPTRSQVFVVPLSPDGEIADADPMFLCSIEGLDDIEFYARGAFGIMADADLHVRTRDGEAIHAIVPDAVSFTRISERRARNPEIERLQLMMQRNTERRMAAMIEERFAREQARRVPDGQAGGPGPVPGETPPPAPASQPQPGPHGDLSGAGDPPGGAGDR